MPRPRPTLPTAASRPPPAPRAGTPLAAAQNAANHAPAGRKLRPLVYALGIAGIAGSGALIGAILKMSHQEEAQKTQHSLREPQSQPDQSEYQRSIQTLETKRAYLLGQKIQLDRKIQALHESQREKAEEEEDKKQFKLNR